MFIIRNDQAGDIEMGVFSLFKRQEKEIGVDERSYGAGQNPLFAMKQQIVEDIFGQNKIKFGLMPVKVKSQISGPIHY